MVARKGAGPGGGAPSVAVALDGWRWTIGCWEEVAGAGRRSRVAVGTAPGERRTAAGGARRPSRTWPWVLAWLGAAAATAVLVRLPGPAVVDPDEHAAALYLDRLAHGQRLEDPLLSTPKPLLTLVHGLAWAAVHDWRLLTALTVAVFALAVVGLARAAGRLGGPPAAWATAVALLGWGAIVLQVARGNSVVWAIAGWAVAADALTRRERRWGVAAAALLLAALARSETWLLLPPAAAWGALAWRRGERGAWLLLVPLAAPLLWLGHDLLLTGDPFYSLGVPERYTDLVAGRHPIHPADWLTLVGRRYARSPLLCALALAGVWWLARHRAWLWLAGLAVLVPGVLILLGFEAARGTYVSWRYYDPADLGVRLAAALGAAWLATTLTRPARRPGRAGGIAVLRRADDARPPGAGGAAVRLRPDGRGAAVLRGAGGGAGVAAAVAAVAAVALVGAACWPLAPADPVVASTLDRDTRLGANTAAAVRLLRPVAARPGTVVAVSGPQRVRVALELGVPLGRVRDLYLATLAGPLDQALAGTAAVFHDADGDRPAERFAPLSVTRPAQVGTVTVVPLRADPGRGLYVLRVESR